MYHHNILSADLIEIFPLKMCAPREHPSSVQVVTPASSSTDRVDTESSLDGSSSSSSPRLSFKGTRRRRRRSVHFAESNNELHVIERYSRQDFPELWYSPKQILDFRKMTEQFASILRLTADYHEHSWSKILLNDYQAMRKANRSEQICDKLLLESSILSANYVGLEILSVKEISGDIKARRSYLWQQICCLQNDPSFLADEEERALAICETSRSCSRAPRLFARHVAQVAAAFTA